MSAKSTTQSPLASPGMGGGGGGGGHGSRTAMNPAIEVTESQAPETTQS
ncbi:MAG: hypothetical protein SFZ24_03770 [Planctomycetota bacterium]|nr:hypothetical protein [Planctomycetota bacterium]